MAWGEQVSTAGNVEPQAASAAVLQSVDRGPRRVAAAPGGEPLLLTQSGAICLYIADKVGKFLPRNKRKRAVALQWFTHAITDVSGYNWASVHVTRVPKVVKANTDFFEVLLFKQLAYCNDRLGKEEYLAGDLSLADFALYPPVLLRAPLIEAYGGLEHLSRWAATMAKRPGSSEA